MTSLEKVYLFLLFILLVPAIMFASLYSSQKEKTEALTQEVHTLTGQLDNALQEWPHGCYLFTSGWDFVDSFPLVKDTTYINKRSQDIPQNIIYRINCY